MLLSLPTALLLLSTTAIASPISRALAFPACVKYTACPTVGLTVPLPLNQTVLAVPANQTVSAVNVGRGVQNYTCTSGAWVTAGALADLYDVSCLFEAPPTDDLSLALPELALAAIPYPNANLPVAYKHLFVSTPGSTSSSAISPAFVSSTNSSDRVVMAKTGSLNAPVDPSGNVAWLQLAAMTGQGSLAKTVFRLDTASGQPPSNCSVEDSELSVPYAAMYFFLN